MERPEKIGLAADVTLLVAAVPVFMTLFYLLPLGSDFPSMARRAGVPLADRRLYYRSTEDRTARLAVGRLFCDGIQHR